MEKMFCYQCQETAQNKGCQISGVCGKDARLSNLQDLLVYCTQELSQVTQELRRDSLEVSTEVNRMVVHNMFMTITNANFDTNLFIERIKETIKVRDELLKQTSLDKETFVHINNNDELVNLAPQVGILQIKDEDERSLRQLIMTGLKGLCAYVKHANVLNYDEKEIEIFIQDVLAELIQDHISQEHLIEMVMKTGEYGVSGMTLLDKANTETYGHPEISKVDIGVGDKPGILISGHDLKDLEMLLEQSEGTGVDIYTHSEMLPAHYYPKFKKYAHFKGNYGNAWWQQQKEFESFNGPILMTTNCIVPVKASYANRLYTTGAAGYPGCPHIEAVEGQKDFSHIIEQAKKSAAPTEIETGEIVGGFAHNQVISLAPHIVEAIQQGAIKKFVVMAGCDGRSKKREYYSEFAEKLPKDTVILTAGCAKYRYNKLNLGDINGIPRVLDAGQCNDSYSLVMIALALKDAFQLEDINELPILYNIAWYEQKAVIVLLALLYLGVKNIHLGPTLPGFLTPNITDFLVKTFGLSPIQSVEEDLELFFPSH